MYPLPADELPQTHLVSIQATQQVVNPHAFDLVTWIEHSFFNRGVVQRVSNFLCDGGVFFFVARNPENPKAKSREGDWRTWREENGIFYLERHETNEETGQREDVWITVDPEKAIIEERINATSKPLALDDKIQILKATGFEVVELKTIEGSRFTGGPGPYWLWVIAHK